MLFFVHKLMKKRSKIFRKGKRLLVKSLKHTARLFLDITNECFQLAISSIRHQNNQHLNFKRVFVLNEADTIFLDVVDNTYNSTRMFLLFVYFQFIVPPIYIPFWAVGPKPLLQKRPDKKPPSKKTTQDKSPPKQNGPPSIQKAPRNKMPPIQKAPQNNLPPVTNCPPLQIDGVSVPTATTYIRIYKHSMDVTKYIKPNPRATRRFYLKHTQELLY